VVLIDLVVLQHGRGHLVTLTLSSPETGQSHRRRLPPRSISRSRAES
jgi:hypothetical protein